MVHTLVIRGFDHDTHSQLGNLSREKGVSINSIVKDAVDQWLKKQKEIPKRHHLLLYEDDKSMIRLLKLMDKFMSGEDKWFKCFIPSSNLRYVELLRGLDWYDTNDENIQYDHSQKNTIEYFNYTLQNIVKKSKNRELCCVDFLLNDIAKSDIKETLEIERAYNQNKLSGLAFCPYKIKDLSNTTLSDIIAIFEAHQQIFVVKEDELYKLNITKENIHKLFLS
ncbi:hypothetical protein [Candidatus Nitrosocosmicus sp. T]